MRAAHSRAASLLLGAFSRRLMVDCEASAAPLSGQRPDRHFHQRIVAQPIEVDGILVTAGDRRGTRHHHLKHRMVNAIGIAAVRHRLGKPPAHTKLALRFAQQQQTGVGGLVAAGKIDCEFLAADGWQVEWEAAYRRSWRLWRSADTRGNSFEQQLVYVNRSFVATAVV